MDASLLPFVAPRPVSEVEWEDLLVRLELMTRALRVTLEGVEAGEGVEAPLRELLAREARLAPWLLALADGGVAAGPADAVGNAEEGEDMAAMAERFVRLRGRNFAMVQRRGLEVWGWEGEFPGLGRVSVHQVLTLLVHADAAALGALRRAAGQGAPC